MISQGGVTYDPYTGLPITWGGGGGGGMTSGAADWWARQGGDGGYPSQAGYYGSGGGMGYIHGGPENDMDAWNMYLEFRRNGYDVPNPFSIEEARRGMGQFTEEEWRRYFENYLKEQQPNISTNDMEPGAFNDPKAGDPGEFDAGVNPPLHYGSWNDALVSMLGKGKLGKLGLGKWLKGQQGEATLDQWLGSLQDDQRVWLEDWMVGLGADKNWEDRLRQGDAPWSRGQDAIDMTSRQNPREPIPERDDRPSPGGGPRGPKGGGGDGGGESEGGGYAGPLGLPAYAGLAFSPSFLAYQPGNTTGTVQFVPGKG